MDVIFILIGVIIGGGASYFIFSLRNKAGNVSKADYETLNNKFNETHTRATLAEDRLATQQQEYSKLSLKFESQETEKAGLQVKVSSLETVIRNNEQKMAEHVNLQKEKTEELRQYHEKLALLQADSSALAAKNTSLTENHTSLKETNQTQAEQIKTLTAQLTAFHAENSTLKANNKALAEKLATQKEEITAIQQTAYLQFEKIAAQILEEKSGKFTEVNKANIEAILKPLGENIDLFKKKVEETYDKESKQRFSLEEKVKELVEQTNKVSSEANNLATALKGQAKKQGNWGEMILESILQQSGLVKNREYFLQQTIKDEEGKNLRPDVLVKLPDNRIIIIDSKVSLVAYDRFSAAESAEEQALHLNEHLKSVYAHIDELTDKQYDNLEDSLDFTMMFVPIEPAYQQAMQSDPDLWAYAYSRRILLISPTNLIACLKMMADLWKRELQSKNAQEIVKRGELLYEKFVAFVDTLADVGKHIDRTQQSYTTAFNQLTNGNGNLVKQAVKLKNLGLKSSKELPVALLPFGLEIEEDDGV
jgi:DNA recombination protein RmuC